MTNRLSNAVKIWPRRWTLVPSLVVIVLAAAPPAWAATPLTGEVLNGTGTTSNQSSACSTPWGYSNPWVNVSFNVSGQATGPYRGTFVASGRAGAQGKQEFGITRASETATLTITSGTTTITGKLSPGIRPYAIVGYGCSSGGVSSFGMNGLLVNYTAVINGQTYQGTGRVGGNFYTNLGPEASASVSDTFTG
jgi:hypothetical protein